MARADPYRTDRSFKERGEDTIAVDSSRVDTSRRGTLSVNDSGDPSSWPPASESGDITLGDRGDLAPRPDREVDPSSTISCSGLSCSGLSLRFMDCTRHVQQHKQTPTHECNPSWHHPTTTEPHREHTEERRHQRAATPTATAPSIAKGASRTRRRRGLLRLRRQQLKQQQHLLPTPRSTVAHDPNTSFAAPRKPFPPRCFDTNNTTATTGIPTMYMAHASPATIM